MGERHGQRIQGTGLCLTIARNNRRAPANSLPIWSNVSGGYALTTATLTAFTKRNPKSRTNWPSWPVVWLEREDAMMTDEPKTAAEYADCAAFYAGEFIGLLHSLSGGPRYATLAGLHAYLVTELAVILGGRTAAEMCERAADQIRDLPPLPHDTLATARPMGSA